MILFRSTLSPEVFDLVEACNAFETMPVAEAVLQIVIAICMPDMKISPQNWPFPTAEILQYEAPRVNYCDI
jgi:hypothetical protein